MNKSKKTYYNDWRLKNVCAYCGGFADTEDHVPSRCFLDAPLPNEPPVVPCCEECNKSFSLDEEYVSCVIDCMKDGTTDVPSIKRLKTRKTLTHSVALAEEIKSQCRDFGGVQLWDYDKDRFLRVIQKLAFGHLAFYNEILAFDSDFHVSMKLLGQMNDLERNNFEQPYLNDLLPEVGSRALQSMAFLVIEDGMKKSLKYPSHWEVVQEGRYRYCTSNESNKVKFVIAEYLAVEVELKD